MRRQLGPAPALLLQPVPGLGGSTHMKKQCAAVRTHCAPMMVPPQMWIGPYCTLTCQGHLATEVSFPPMIRPEILCPQAGGESRAQRGGKPGAGCTASPPPAGTQNVHRGQRE